MKLSLMMRAFFLLGEKITEISNNSNTIIYNLISSERIKTLGLIVVMIDTVETLSLAVEKLKVSLRLYYFSPSSPLVSLYRLL